MKNISGFQNLSNEEKFQVREIFDELDFERYDLGVGVNKKIAETIEQVAEEEQQIFKQKAFQNAALEIRKLQRELKPHEQYKKIKGVGKASAKIIEEWFADNY